LLAVVDLAQIQHPALNYFARSQPAAFLHTEIAMLLAVLETPVGTKKHACWQNARESGFWEEGRPTLHATLETGDCRQQG
jgi:hypothetical protein